MSDEKLSERLDRWAKEAQASDVPNWMNFAFAANEADFLEAESERRRAQIAEALDKLRDYGGWPAGLVPAVCNLLGKYATLESSLARAEDFAKNYGCGKCAWDAGDTAYAQNDALCSGHGAAIRAERDAAIRERDETRKELDIARAEAECHSKNHDTALDQRDEARAALRAATYEDGAGKLRWANREDGEVDEQTQRALGASEGEES